MKHGQNNNRRQRSRGGNPRRYPNQKGGSFESNGPEAKVRGTAQQVLEKYQALSRDAYSAGDRILAEGYLQHAEHYYRILNSESEGSGRDGNRGRQVHGNRDEDMNRDDDMDNEDDNTQSYSQSNSRSNSQSDGDPESQADSRPEPDSDEENGLKRTVSRGQNGNRRQPDAEASSNDADAVTDQAGADDAEPAAPRKPRARRPRKTEQRKSVV